MDLLEKLRQEVRVIKGAPFSFVVFVVIGIAVGFYASNWYFSKQLSDDSSQINRYQVVLGIKPGSPGSLVELNNQELALKAQSIVAKLREYQAEMESKGAQIDAQVADKKINKDEAFKGRQDLMNQISEEFDSNLASDAYNVENELRSRLSPEALSHVVMVPGFVSKDANGNVIPHSRVTMMQLMRGPSESMFLSGLANEMDQMAKLLPSD